MMLPQAARVARLEDALELVERFNSTVADCLLPNGYTFIGGGGLEMIGGAEGVTSDAAAARRAARAAALSPRSGRDLHFAHAFVRGVSKCSTVSPSVVTERPLLNSLPGARARQ